MNESESEEQQERWHGEDARVTETAEWRGTVNEKLRVLAKTAEKTALSMEKMADKVEGLHTQVTKLIVYVGLGAFFGSAIISIIVGVAIKMMSK
jgi:hypothetical protein